MDRFYRAVVLLLIVARVPYISAQDDVPPADYVYQGKEIADFQWFPDGTGLTITEMPVPLEQWAEVEYSLETQHTRLSSDLPIIRNLRLREGALTKDLFAHTGSSVFWPSPDNQWAVYPVIEDGAEYLALHKIQTEEVHILYDAPLLVPYGGYLEIHWSENSSAFYVYNTNGPWTYWYYLSNFTDSLDNAHVLAMHPMSPQNENEFRRTVRGFHDALNIDATGNFLLIEQEILVDDKRRSALILVNMNDYSFTSLVVTRSIIAASFGPGEEIFCISSEGLFVYDPENNLARLLRSDINSSWIQDVEISPDGRYMAAVEGGYLDTLHIIPITP